MWASASCDESRRKSFTRRLAERRMLLGIVDFVSPLTQACVEGTQRPGGMPAWINRFRDLAHVLGHLGVAC